MVRRRGNGTSVSQSGRKGKRPICAVREEFKCESRIISRRMPAVLGPLWLWTTRREEKKPARGKTYEPPTIIEPNHSSFSLMRALPGAPVIFVRDPFRP